MRWKQGVNVSDHRKICNATSPMWRDGQLQDLSLLSCNHTDSNLAPLALKGPARSPQHTLRNKSETQELSTAGTDCFHWLNLLHRSFGPYSTHALPISQRDSREEESISVPSQHSFIHNNSSLLIPIHCTLSCYFHTTDVSPPRYLLWLLIHLYLGLPLCVYLLTSAFITLCTFSYGLSSPCV